jgi:N-acetylmuramoyl-L-alanine amidase
VIVPNTKINKRLAACVAVVQLILSGPAVGSAGDLVRIRFGETSPTATRIVFDADSLPDYRISSESVGEGRLIVQLPNLRASESLAASASGRGHVAAFSAADERGGMRISLEFRRSARIQDVFVIPPSAANPHHRLVIDLVSAPIAELAASVPARQYDSLAAVIADVAPPEPPEATAAAPAPPQQPSTPRPVIVVDAGHGGSDPGAAGPAGARESATTLSAALLLADLLSETGRYDVVLTRSDDTRLAHEERSRIARDAKAQLFISLHADAHPNPKVRGGSVYTLSDEGSERSAKEALAQGNYQVFDLDIGEADPQVGGILYNLAQRRTGDESDKFAELLIGKLAGVTPLLNNSHRRGNFRVLLAPDVPAVLLELAFISNPHDEANLQSVSWRKRAMAAVAAAIDAYFQQRSAAKHASNAAAKSPP